MSLAEKKPVWNEVGEEVFSRIMEWRSQHPKAMLQDPQVAQRDRAWQPSVLRASCSALLCAEGRAIVASCSATRKRVSQLLALLTLRQAVAAVPLPSEGSKRLHPNPKVPLFLLPTIPGDDARLLFGRTGYTGRKTLGHTPRVCPWAPEPCGRTRPACV